MDIDTRILFNGYTRGNSKIWEAVKRAQKEGFTAELKKISDEGETIKREANKKLAPLFEALVKLGYDKRELMT